MAKTSGEFEKEFIDSAKEKTGKSIEQWLPVIKKSGLSKQMEITTWLKEQGMNHMQASLMAGLYLNDGKPVYQNEDNLFEYHFIKCPEVRPLFDKVSVQILKHFPDAQLIPKKTYLSYTAIREFAAINIKPKELRLGMDLGEITFSEKIQKSKLTGPMPRISHMTIITVDNDFDKETLSYIQESYNRSHKK